MRNLDAMKENGQGLYGGGFLISHEAAAEREAAEREAAERAAAERAHIIELSERERKVVDSLSRGTE